MGNSCNGCSRCRCDDPGRSTDQLTGVVNFGHNEDEDDQIFMSGTPDPHENRKLCEAIMEGRLDRVQKLVQEGARVNVKSMDNKHRSPLHVAVHFRQPEICKYLIDAGAKRNQLDCVGASAIFWAVQNGCKETTRALLDMDCYLHTRKKIPFHAATSRNDVELMHLLFVKGANPEQKGLQGFTPLHISAINGYYEAAHFLIVGICVSLDPLCARNETPFHLAMSRRHHDIVELLVMAGCNISKERSVYDREPHWLMGVEDEMKLTQKYAWYVRNPRSLQELCIFNVRRRLGTRLPKVVNLLPVPVKVRNLLKLTHIRQSDGKHKRASRMRFIER